MGRVMRPRPSILHVFSDWKWTGPAEPIVNLCRHLRRHGHVVDLACARPPYECADSLEQRARERHVEPVLDFNLRKGANPFLNLADVRALAEFIDREEVEIVHAHTGHDHYIASRAARRANNQPFVVRTNHLGAPLPPTWINRWVVCGYTDGWVALTPSCRDEDVRNFHLDPDAAVAVEGAVDLERFDAGRSYRDIRPEVGLSAQHLVAGVVARVQRHRRFDVLLPAMARAMEAEPRLRAMIIGRGTHLDAIARQPARRLGIADRTIFTGYRLHDYPDYLASIDFLIFLVPGSDGSCRAVREAMALGKPVIASRRGLLPELVEHERCGLVTDDSPDELAAAILRLTRDEALRRRLGEAAARKAREKFGLERQVEIVADLYMRLVERT